MGQLELPIFWTSYDAHGSIERFSGTDANGQLHDLGIWSRETEEKTGRRIAIPHDSVDAALERLAEKHTGFHVVSDVVAALEKEA